ncbi:hypothetical protein SAMN05661091_2993 [Paenibacillus uliginis N3/975]|uniref:Uncharacterized protein n=1 Tax=Paenibacillus uliginis N3/975 TaxID=1313296 RepID=A0A1X7HG11_9BACL|nr:hypothetical protein [Paenibacillus uliginis]SMF85403.1 hypothetical protein SAMN05661091_2993 [Paenibacillus uliginis N3/975]
MGKDYNCTDCKQTKCSCRNKQRNKNTTNQTNTNNPTISPVFNITLPSAAAAFTPQYAQVYQENNFLVTVPSNTDISFNTTGLISPGITHTPGSAIVTVNEGGIYAVDFEVTLALGDLGAMDFVQAAWGVTMNNARVNSTESGLLVSESSTLIVNTISSTAIVNIPNGAQLTLRNIGVTADLYVGLIDGQEVKSASLRLIKIAENK